MEADLAMIFLFAGNFSPRGFASCEGQILSISQNTALFSLLGTTYGGNGQTTFALPDLRGRVPVGQGQGPGLSPYVEGQTGGQENVTLSTSQMPAHTHSIFVNAGVGTTDAPSGTTYFARPATGSGPNASLLKLFTTNAPNVALPANGMAQQGGNLPHPNMQPYLSLFYVIAVEGIFPSRN